MISRGFQSRDLFSPWCFECFFFCVGFVFVARVLHSLRQIFPAEEEAVVIGFILVPSQYVFDLKRYLELLAESFEYAQYQWHQPRAIWLAWFVVKE